VFVETSFCRVFLVAGLAFAASAQSSFAWAESSPMPGSAAAPNAPPSATEGLAVLALPGATDAAWPLASSVYAAPSLRPDRLDEAHAHVLCGEAAAGNAPAELRDLADTVAAVHGDDAPSRALLGAIARRFSVRAIIVVRSGAPAPSARVFLADTASFDAATYTPDEGSRLSWAAATRSLVRAFGSAGSAPAEGAGASSNLVRAPALATHKEPKVESAPAPRKAFYESGWFWGAIGAAAFGAGAVYLATRDTGPSVIHLQLEVPH
jgi:hypothetical protein